MNSSPTLSKDTIYYEEKDGFDKPTSHDCNNVSVKKDMAGSGGDCPASGHVLNLSKELCYQSFGSVIMMHSIWLPDFVIFFMNFCKSFAVRAWTTFL